MLAKKEISGYTLKWIAILAMFIDHLTASGAFVSSIDQYQLGRGIGRTAFPIFCFLMVEGYFYTKNRYRYLSRLILLAFLSEIPFDMLFSGAYWDMSNQNVFFTLSLGLIGILGFDEIEKRTMRQMKTVQGIQYRIIQAMSAILQLGVVVLAGASAGFLKTDYATNGVLLIFMIYFLEKFYVMFQDSIRKYGEQKVKNMLAGFAICLWFLLYDFGGGRMNEIYGFPAVLLVYLYNGKRGKYTIPSWVFYAFYPLHLLVVVFIRNMYYRIWL